MAIERAELLAKVPDLEAREKAVALWQAWRKAEEALAEAQERTPADPRRAAALDAIEDERARKLKELREKHMAACRQLKQEYDARIAALPDVPEIARLRAAAEAAGTAFDACDLAIVTVVEDDGSEDIERCALSGVPLLESDDVLTDRCNGQSVLRCLILPPPEEDDREAAA